MEIKFDQRNYRKHNYKNKELINKSLSECGAGRSILIDKDNNIILETQKIAFSISAPNYGGKPTVWINR